MKRKANVRKLAVTLLTVTLSFFPLTACGGSPSTSSGGSVEVSASDIQLVKKSHYGLVYGVPNNWDEYETDDGDKYYDAPGHGVMFVSMTSDITFSNDTDDDVAYITGQYIDSQDFSFGDIDKSSDGDAIAYFGELTKEENDGTYRGFVKFIISGSTIYTVFTYVPEARYDSQIETLEAVMDSVHVAAPSAPVQESVPVETVNSTADTSEKSDSATTSQKNAVEKAKSYIAMTGFSHDGLVDQLKYEGFSDEDAAYGADNCGADWNAEALEKAKGYIDMTGFSYDGLVDQLEYEGFTSDQATYGADNCGADWNAEAAEKAKSYMDMQSFSRSRLIGQLEYEGFTADQAAYGADSVGL